MCDHHQHPHTHDHDHSHGHSHDHDHQHNHAPGQDRRIVEIGESILEDNDRVAVRNRELFQEKGLLVINVLSSPGSGKTTFLRETAKALSGRLKTGVVVGDLATDNDAQRLRESGAPVVQITTGTMCHLEADMLQRALKVLDLEGLKLLIVENVGNLVCPASFDLGEDLRIVLLSVTEGEDKPLKYPPMFQSAQVVILSKMDLAEACEFNREAALANIRRVAPAAKIFEVSAKRGQGMPEWCDYLVSQHQTLRT